MSRAETAMQAVYEFMDRVCARQASADLCYEAPDGTVITCRVRLLAVTPDELLADQPSYRGRDRRIPEGRPITVHVSQNGCRFQFDSVIQKARHPVQINKRTRVPGIVLRLPVSITESQRRGHYRVSLAAKDTIVVGLARSHPDVPGACPVNADVLQGRMVDLSTGGAAVLVDEAAGAKLQVGQLWFLTFGLPDVSDEFCMFSSIRHMRVIESSDSTRIGFVFRSWAGRRLTVDQRLLARSVADFQRQSLRARG